MRRIGVSLAIGILCLAGGVSRAPAAVALQTGNDFNVLVDTLGASQGRHYEALMGGLWVVSNAVTSTTLAFPPYLISAISSDSGAYVVTSTYASQTYFTSYSVTYSPWGYAHGSFLGAYALDVTVQGGSGPVTFGFNPPATFEESGREVVLGPQTIDSLEVTRKVYVPTGDSWVRHLIILHNPTGADITATLRVSGHFDVGFARVFATSSGDRVASSADRWVVTTAANFCCLPSVFTVIDGQRRRDKVDALIFQKGSGDGSWRWRNITVAPGQTKVYAFFAGGETFPRAARSLARRIGRMSAGLTGGMSAEEIAETRNWNFAASAAAPPEEVGGIFGGGCGAVAGDEDSAPGGLGFVALGVALVGLAQRRRRR